MRQIIIILLSEWGSVTKAARFALFGALVMFAAVAAIRIATPFYFSHIIAELQEGSEAVLLLVAMYPLLFFGTRALEEGKFTAYVHFELILHKALYLRIFRTFYFIPFSAAMRRQPSEHAIIVDRGLGGLRNLTYNLVFAIAPLAIETAVLVAVLSVVVGPYVVAGAVSILAVLLAVTYWVTSRISRLQEVWYATVSSNFKILSENLKAYETIRSFGQSAWATNRYGRAADRFVREVMASMKPYIPLGAVQGFLLGLLVLLVSTAVIRQHGSLPSAIPTLVLVNGLLLQIIAPLMQFAGAYRAFVQGISSARQLLNILSEEPAPGRVEHSADSSLNGLSARDLKVRLGGRLVLDVPSMEIRRNRCTVITGRTGAGKSTLARTLGGLCEYEGTIRSSIDGNRIFYAGQLVDVFDASLEENVCLGLQADRGRLRDSLKRAGFTKDELRGLQTRSLGENGNRISGGQKSRLGIARMLYHQAELLIFDEPTAALDGKTAAHVMRTIGSLKGRSTVVVVSHDPGFRDLADDMIKIGDGKPVSAGQSET